MDRTINGRTLAQRRAARDAIDDYPREKLEKNRARAILEAKRKEEKLEADAKARRESASVRHDMNAPLYKVWAMVRPTLRTAFTSEAEATLMVAICAVRIAELMAQTTLTNMLFRTLNSRDVGAFRTGIIRGTAVSVGAAVLDIMYNYLQQRLNWKWRVKLTKTMHDKYFANMNYYFMGAGGGRRQMKMEDPDTRITGDLAQTVNGFTQCFSRAMNSTLTGVLYTAVVWRRFGWRFALAPYVYLFASRYFCQKVIPMREIFRRNGRARGVSWGRYRFALQRQELQGEAIGALRGGEREMEIIIDEFAVHVEDCHKHHWDFLTFHSLWNFFIIQGGDALVNILCIGRGIWYPRYEQNDTIEKMSELRGDVGEQMMLFERCLFSARTALQLITELQQLIGHVERVTEMVEMLDAVTKNTASEETKSIIQEDCIAFEDVSIVTPTGVQLVDKLSFRLDKGDSLLIVGHNGAGKSSIFRCLGGLWSIPCGTIRKPGGGDASEKGASNDAMFYIPQKPYQVVGTLIDQMTYPKTDAADELTKDRMREILAEVDLEYLLEREGALTDDIIWEDELSLSEKQRLAIARLIFNKPRYAILDECSSAITAHMEQNLYKICLQNEITYVTIAHRPSLQAFHDKVLAIGDGKCGFTLKTLDNTVIKEHVKLMAARSVLPEEVERGIREKRKARSEKYAGMSTPKELPKRSTWQRWLRIWMIAKPNYAYLRFAGVCVFIGLQTWLEDYATFNTGAMYGALMTLDKARMVKLSRNALIAAAVLGYQWEQMLYIERTLGLVMSDRFERHLAARLAKNNMGYKMQHVDGRVKDIDHRISMDGGILLRHNIGQILIGVIRPVVKVVVFTYRIGVLAGWKIPALMVGYYFISGYAMQKCMPNFRELWEKHSKLEAKFHAAHARVKVCAESIAFFDGGAREQKLVEGRFMDVMEWDWYRLKVDFRFNCLKDIFETRIPDVLRWCVLFYYGVQAGGSDADVIADRGQKINEGQTYIQAMLPQITQNLGQCLRLSTFIAEMAGKIHRTAEMQEILDELEDATELAELERAERHAAEEAAGTVDETVRVSMSGCDVVTPRGECIVSDLSFDVSEGQGLMVTGRGGTGKTSFARVMGQLWEPQGGSFKLPRETGDPLVDLKKVFVVPQKIHMALGSLQDQITYPQFIPREERTAELEVRLQAMLDLVGIGYLVKRWEGDADETNYQEHAGWDHIVRWEDVLSLGEQQRMGVARMFYHEPKIAVLDECTSAVSVDVEEGLYRRAVERGITLVTLSQQMTLPEFHPLEIVIGENKTEGWTVREVDMTMKNRLLSGVSSGARDDAIASID